MEECTITKALAPRKLSQQQEAKVIALALKYPTIGPVRAANALRHEGVILSPSGVRYVWTRNNVETVHKRIMKLRENSLLD